MPPAEPACHGLGRYTLIPVLHSAFKHNACAKPVLHRKAMHPGYIQFAQSQKSEP